MAVAGRESDPGVGRFATEARRTVPVAVLEPLEE